jgi:Fic family protein
MRREEFGPDAPGELLPIAGSEGVAFLPDPLPPAIAPSWALAEANQEAALVVGQLAGQARLISNEELVTGALVLREAVESNRIEGTQTLIEDVLLQRVAGPPGDRASADANLEVLRYVESVHAGAEAIRDGQPFSLFLIRSLHRTLIEGTRGDSINPGAFRSKAVAIGRPGDGFEEARFVPPPPELVPDAMAALAEFAEAIPPFGALIGCGLLHYQFETIHPFEDGNGRLGRLLLPLYLVRRGVMERPLLYLSHYLERNRDEYIRLLKGKHKGEWEPWLLFFLKGVQLQARDALDRASRVLALQASYRERVRQRARSQAALATLDLAMEKVFVTVPGVAGSSGGTTRRREPLSTRWLISACSGPSPRVIPSDG